MIGPGWAAAVPVLVVVAGTAVERVGGRGGAGGTGDQRFDVGTANWTVSLLPGVLALGLALLRLSGGDGGVAGIWLDDRLGRTMLVLALLPWPVAVALGGTGHGVGRVIAAVGSVVACLANGIFPTLIGLGCAMVAAVPPRPEDAHRLTVPATILGVAWFGAVMLSGVVGAAPTWSGLAALRGPDAARYAGDGGAGTLMLGAALLGAFWWASSAPESGHRVGGAAPGVRGGMVGGVAACLLLRMLALPGAAGLATAALAAGCMMLVWSMLIAAARPPQVDRSMGAATVLGGTALLGFAAGGGPGVLGGLLALFSLGMAGPLARQAGRGWRARLAPAILAGLPPFAPFAALLLVGERMFALSIAVAVLLLIATAVSMAHVLAPSRRGRRSDAARERRVGTLATQAVVLVLLLLGGLLLPPVVASWLLQFAPQASGAGR